MAREQAVDISDVIANKESEAQTYQARSSDESPVQPGEFVTRKGKRQGQGRGDQHHSRDGADAENQQVEHCPFRLSDGAQNEEGDGGGTGQAVDDADEQRPQGMKKSQSLEGGAQALRSAPGKPAGWREAFAMVILARGVRMPVKVHAGAVSVDVGMFSGHARMRWREFFAQPLHRTGQV